MFFNKVFISNQLIQFSTSGRVTHEYVPTNRFPNLHNLTEIEDIPVVRYFPERFASSGRMTHVLRFLNIRVYRPHKSQTGTRDGGNLYVHAYVRAHVYVYVCVLLIARSTPLMI